MENAPVIRVSLQSATTNLDYIPYGVYASGGITEMLRAGEYSRVFTKGTSYCVTLEVAGTFDDLCLWRDLAVENVQKEFGDFWAKWFSHQVSRNMIFSGRVPWVCLQFVTSHRSVLAAIRSSGVLPPKGRHVAFDENSVYSLHACMTRGEWDAYACALRAHADSEQKCALEELGLLLRRVEVTYFG